MHRFFTQEPCQIGTEAALQPEEARHAEQVLRLLPGDSVELLDGAGLYAARLVRVGKQSVTAEVLERLPSREPRLRVTLFQGLAKGDKMEAIVQKCTELGVHAVQPLEMARCVQKLDHKRAQAQQERWQRIAREATKQCGRAWVPPIYLPQSPDAPTLAKRWAEQGMLIVPWEEAEHGGLRTLLTAPQAGEPACHIGLVIGPEGGMTEAEIARMHALGARIVTLGSRILRTETAGMAALAAMMALCGEME